MLKMTYPYALAATFFIASLAATCHAEAQLSDTSGQEKANLEKAIYCMNLLENKLDVDTAERECFSEVYIQHSPHVADGKAEVLKLFRARAKRFPNYSARIVRAAANGDMVWLHMHTKRRPEDRGSAVVNIFRMKDGKFAEHWGVGQPVPETSKNNNGMF